jgi:hypothetical protein
MKTLKIEANQVGKRHALVADGATFSVYAECSNYESGCTRKSWRYVQRNLDLAAAQALFARRLAGKKH